MVLNTVIFQVFVANPFHGFSQVSDRVEVKFTRNLRQAFAFKSCF